jgi:hypothetical protein
VIFQVVALMVTTAVLLLLTGTVSAQAGQGQITVKACQDQNADGYCTDNEQSLPGAEACLNDESTCQPVPATFTDLPAGDYIPFLRFTGSTQGYYPTTPRTSVNLASGESVTVSLGAVYPVHPKGVAVHEALNKVYVAFQGPLIDGVRPYPFVAVIDGETDEVLRTIPGGENGSVPGAPNGMGVGREPWGVAVPRNGAFVYVGSFGDNIIAAIDPVSDTVTTNVSPGAPFQPTAPTVNPITGRVHFPDRAGGRVLILNDDPKSFLLTPILSKIIINDFPSSYSPFEIALAKSLLGHNFVTMRDAAHPDPFKFVGFNTATFSPIYYDILFNTSTGQASGMPHAVAVWQDEGSDEAHLFITYADDLRPAEGLFPNPDKLLIYDFSILDPDVVTLRQANIEVGDYAEVGLVYNPATNHMLGTYAGFAYTDPESDESACDHPARGGTYALDDEGNLLEGDVPGVWKLPSRVVGNPPFEASDMQWRNPFEIAINPNNGKIYVTDRCWSDYPTGGQAGGGAVLIFEDSSNGEPTPTPTATGTPPTATPTVTGTPPTNTPTATGTPPTATPTSTGTPPTATPTVTGTPPTATPTATPAPITLTFSGPISVTSGDTFSVTVQALNVTGLGLYGAQFDINYAPTLISADNLQVSPDLPFVVLKNIDNTIGTIQFLASRQGEVPGLIGDVPLLTFEATAIGQNGEVTFTFENERIGDPVARPFDTITQNYTVSIQPITTPEPTATPTAAATPTATPTATGTPPTATSTATGTPPTATSTATGTPPTATSTATGTPTTATPTVTGTPPTSTPTLTGTPPTATPTETGTPSTGTPTVTGTPPTATPTETGTPSGNLTLTGLVYDAMSGPTRVIPGANVSALMCVPRRFQTLSGVNGRYQLVLPAKYINACDQITLEVSAFDYEPFSIVVSVNDLRAQPERDFALTPLLTPTPTTTPPTATPTVSDTPSTSTPTVTGTPSTGTPTVTGTPSTSTPTVTGTPSTGTPTVTGTPSTTTPTVTGTPSTATPGVTVVVTVTGTPSAATPTVTGTPPTATPTVTDTPPTVTPGVTVVVTVTGTPSSETPTPTGPNVVIIIGQVSLPGRESDDWSGVKIIVEDDEQPMSATTDEKGHFIAEVSAGTYSAIKADAPGYLPAICANPVIGQAETALTNTALLSGDIDDDDRVDITDAVAIGLDFGANGSTVPADINRSGEVDVLDVILVGVNYGKSTQAWDCLGE